jgi:Fe-S cluster biosynthesis and repair protein YggX
MALLVDDILMLPATLGKVIFATLVQTVEKVAWSEYSRDLKKLLLRARNDYDTQKITQNQFKEIEQHVFNEMKVAKYVIAGRS